MALSFNKEALLAAFPPVRYGMAYGSGVFSQEVGSSSAPQPPPMVDFVFAVDDPAAWHAANLRRNRAHYPYLAAAAGPALIAGVQESRFGARVWYNALVPVPQAALVGGAPTSASVSPRLMKYGVISTRALLEDLTQWSTLYVAGRLHKPVMALQCAAAASLPLRSGGSAPAPAPHSPPPQQQPPLPVDAALDAALSAALRANLRSALCAALLLLPRSFTALQLFSAVTGLSYTGDWRMAFGEDPHKVRNIVRSNLAAFFDLYSPLLCEAPFAGLVSVGSGAVGAEISCDSSARARVELGLALPLALQRRMAAAALAGSSSSSSSGSGSSDSSSRGATMAAATASTRAAFALHGVSSSSGSSSGGSSSSSSSGSSGRGLGRGGAGYTALREPAIAAFWERALARGGEHTLRESLNESLVGIVAPSARGQSIKGLLTAGPAKSMAYAAAKLTKSFRGFMRG